MSASADKVWLDMDQATLDAAYSQSNWAPNMLEVLARYASASDATRARIGAPERHGYGPSPSESLDLYRTRAASGAVLIFVHGGAWNSGQAHDYGFVAGHFVDAGANVVVPDFAHAEDCAGDLRVMADQLRESVTWVAAHAADFGADASRIFVAGHSSGAHLASVLLSTDWQARGLPTDVLKGGLCCSGMYDLKPVLRSVRGKYLAQDDTMEDALSAQRHIARVRAPLIIAHGGRESPEFQRHARDFVSALQAAGKPVLDLRCADLNHFEILETLAAPQGVLAQAMRALMTL